MIHASVFSRLLLVLLLVCLHLISHIWLELFERQNSSPFPACRNRRSAYAPPVNKELKCTKLEAWLRSRMRLSLRHIWYTSWHVLAHL